MSDPGASLSVMADEETFARLKAVGAIPVLSFEDLATARQVTDILIAESLPAIEVTFRTKAATEVIAGLRRSHPGLLVGAGTLLSASQVEAAVEAGAGFGVAPGLTEAVLHAARMHQLPFVPGVATPTEIERGLSFGLKLLKWFPAESLGGARGLAQTTAPYLHTGLQFMPTGGINGQSAPEYLRLPFVLAVGGSWMIPATALKVGDRDVIAAAVREAVAIVRDAREAREH